MQMLTLECLTDLRMLVMKLLEMQGLERRAKRNSYESSYVKKVKTENEKSRRPKAEPFLPTFPAVSPLTSEGHLGIPMSTFAWQKSLNVHSSQNRVLTTKIAHSRFKNAKYATALLPQFGAPRRIQSIKSSATFVDQLTWVRQADH